MTNVHRTALLLLGLAGLASACQSGDDSGARQISAKDGVSFARLEGWTTSREKGTLVLTGSPAKGQSRSTIAVRTAKLDDWSEPRTPENTLPSVARVLHALPGAAVVGPMDIEHPVYRGSVFDVVFSRPGASKRRYQRRHIVLFGDTKIIHVLATAPEGQLERSRSELDNVVKTIREEG